jgi:membrane protease YdiL (CAAX protease family)
MFADPPLGSQAAARVPVAAGSALWRGSDLLLGVALLIGGTLGLGLVLGVYAAVSGADVERGVAAAALTLAFELGLGGIVALLAWRRRLGPRALGFVRPRRLAPLWLALGGVYVSLIAYQLLLDALAELGLDVSGLGEGNALPIEEGASRAELALLGLSVVVGAPLGEELFFRGLLFRGLQGLWGWWPALGGSALLFAAFHLNVSVLVPFLAVGALLAWAYRASGSLWVPIAVHAAFNGVSFALTLLLDGGG